VARESLVTAERAFDDDGDTILVRDQAYIAGRKAELAESLARIEMFKRGISAAGQETERLEDQDAARTKAALATSQNALSAQRAAGAASAKELETERLRRIEAEKRANQAAADLARIGSVKQEERGHGHHAQRQRAVRQQQVRPAPGGAGEARSGRGGPARG
jgi:hypothetical protein